jgi:mono/diheme cytochrome c family protein
MMCAAVLAALSVVLAGASASGTEQDEYVKAGRAFAEKNCSRCHALGDSGASPHAKAPPFRLVVAGHPDMPVYVLQPGEIAAFLAYLDSLGPKGPRPKQLR